MTTPATLVDLALHLNRDADRRLGSSRQLAAALVLRQALEAAIDDLWHEVAPDLATCAARAQLVSLPFLLNNERLARDAVYAWYQLTRACHHDEYDLPPTDDEVERLAGTVRSILAANA
jgi:hypothetical protein